MDYGIKPSQDDTRFWHHESIRMFRSHSHSGKWMIFLHISELDEAWEKVKAALHREELGPAIKCSTKAENPRQVDMESAVIVCYTNNYEDEKDLERVLKNIRALGFKQKMYYKKDETTYAKIYGEKSWYKQVEATT